MGDDADEEIEYVILNKREVFVYQIPPASSAQGHKADDWKNCIWRGRVQLVGRGKHMAIKLLDSTSGQLFARCDIPNGEHDKFVNRTVDSSRYFVLKISNQGRHTFIGIGFEDRNDAFDFNCGMVDFKTTFVEREDANNQKSMIAAPAKDLSLKDGQKISVNFKGIGGGQSRRDKQQQQQSSGGLGLAPPPPAGGQSRRQQPAPGGYSGGGGFAPPPAAPAQQQPAQAPAPAAGKSPWGDDPWGDFDDDFQSAPAAPTSQFQSAPAPQPAPAFQMNNPTGPAPAQSNMAPAFGSAPAPSPFGNDPFAAPPAPSPFNAPSQTGPSQPPFGGPGPAMTSAPPAYTAQGPSPGPPMQPMQQTPQQAAPPAQGAFDPFAAFMASPGPGPAGAPPPSRPGTAGGAPPQTSGVGPGPMPSSGAPQGQKKDPFDDFDIFK